MHKHPSYPLHSIVVMVDVALPTSRRLRLPLSQAEAKGIVELGRIGCLLTRYNRLELLINDPTAEECSTCWRENFFFFSQMSCPQILTLKHRLVHRVKQLSGDHLFLQCLLCRVITLINPRQKLIRLVQVSCAQVLRVNLVECPRRT